MRRGRRAARGQIRWEKAPCRSRGAVQGARHGGRRRGPPRGKLGCQSSPAAQCGIAGHRVDRSRWRRARDHRPARCAPRTLRATRWRVAQLTGRYNERAGVTNELHLQVIDAAGKVVVRCRSALQQRRWLPPMRWCVVRWATPDRGDGCTVALRRHRPGRARPAVAHNHLGDRGHRRRGHAAANDRCGRGHRARGSSARCAHGWHPVAVVIADAVPGGQRIRAGVGGLAGPNRLIEVASGQERVGSVDGTLIGRRAVVAWGTQAHGEEPHGPWSVRAATSPDGAAFERPQVVDPGRVQWYPPSYRIALAALPGGGALLAWSQAGSTPDDAQDRSLLMAATAGATGSSRRHSASAGGALGGLAVDAAGHAALPRSRLRRHARMDASAPRCRSRCAALGPTPALDRCRRSPPRRLPTTAPIHRPQPSLNQASCCSAGRPRRCPEMARLAPGPRAGQLVVRPA